MTLATYDPRSEIPTVVPQYTSVSRSPTIDTSWVPDPAGYSTRSLAPEIPEYYCRCRCRGPPSASSPDQTTPSPLGVGTGMRRPVIDTDMEVELAPSLEHDDYMKKLREEKERVDAELAEAARRWVMIDRCTAL
eukprot:6063118-Pyramimonas_sp.AAC.1